MVKIAPSVLSCDFSRFGDECREVLAAGADWLHFDVMDGVFVPNLSLGIGELKSMSKAVDAFYDVHLMIIDPLRYAAAFCAAGADMLTFHIESQSDPYKTIRTIRECGAKVGITLRPATPARDLFGFLPLVDMVLVMTVEPGLGGQRFMAGMVPKITEIKQEAARLGREVLVEVDGGINADTAPIVLSAGADVLVAGSAIFGQADRREAIARLRAAAVQ